MIKFEDFFNIKFPDLTKVKFNMNEGNKEIPAWDLLREDNASSYYQRWLNMNAHYEKNNSNNNYGNAKYVLTFAQYYLLGKEFYIFGGLYEIKPKKNQTNNSSGYILTKMPDYEQYEKRLIIKLLKPVGQRYNLWYRTVLNNCAEIYEILPPKVLDDFPGFNNVLLDHKDLQYIFRNQAPEWKRQLSSVKGIYCITDKANGKIYVGSAYGQYAGLWQRWEQYANVKNLTGGNKYFENFKKEGNEKYIVDNFQYSILEIMDTKTPDEDILKRESHWKDVFKSREYGMNKN